MTIFRWIYIYIYFHMKMVIRPKNVVVLFIVAFKVEHTLGYYGTLGTMPVQKVSDLGAGKQSSVSGWLQYLLTFKVGPLSQWSSHR
jgi:hypothetical protein